MKKLASLLLIAAMLVTMIPMAVVSASAAETVTLPTATWNDEGNYDVSWCTAGTANGADSVKVGNNWYKVLNYSATVFEIKDAADLAGLSVLTNAANRDKSIGGNPGMRTNPLFANVTFNITADIDLTGKLWVPIAKEFAQGKNEGSTGVTVFGGNLNGNKNGAAITIKGMTVNVVARTDDPSRGQAAGLVGVQGGGSIKNINLTNAYVTSDTKFAVGSFVGRQWGAVYSGGDPTKTDATAELRSKTVYENLSSDATLIKTTDSSEIQGAIGGIAGVTADGQYKNYYTNCTFTGEIISTGAQCGGIVGYSENGSGAIAYFKNCVVTGDITNGGTKASDVKGIGGLIGGGKCNIDAESCYVSSTITCDSSLAIYTGGMAGHLIGLGGAKYVKFVDCHFDGIIKAKTYDYNGAFVGCINDVGINVTFKNCLSTGVLTNSKITMMVRGMAYIGIVTANNKDFGTALNTENAYSAVKAPLVNSVVGEEISLMKVNGVAVTATTDILAAEVTTANIAEVKGDLAKTKMAGMFGTDTKWVARADKYPTLKLVENVADTTYASADYSWFDYAKAASKAEGVTIDDANKLLALSKMEKACGGTLTFADLVSNYKIAVSGALTSNIDALFSEENATMLKTGVIPVAPSDDDNEEDNADDKADNTKETEAETKKTSDTTEKVEEEKGCGGVIGGAAVVLVATLGCAAVAGKKRKED